MRLVSKKRDVKEIVNKTLESGGSYIQAAEKLTALGFKSARGGEINKQQVSYFMRSHGVRLRTKYKTRASSHAPRAKATPQAETTKILPTGVRMVDIEEVVTSNLTDKLKLITISALMKG